MNVILNAGRCRYALGVHSRTHGGKGDGTEHEGNSALLHAGFDICEKLGCNITRGRAHNVCARYEVFTAHSYLALLSLDQLSDTDTTAQDPIPPDEYDYYLGEKGAEKTVRAHAQSVASLEATLLQTALTSKRLAGARYLL